MIRRETKSPDFTSCQSSFIVLAALEPAPSLPAPVLKWNIIYCRNKTYVLTSAHFGFAVVDASKGKAASSNAGSRSPLFFQPNAPPILVSNKLPTINSTDQLEPCPQRIPSLHHQTWRRSSTSQEPLPSCRVSRTELSQDASSTTSFQKTDQNMSDIYKLRSLDLATLLLFLCFTFTFPLRSASLVSRFAFRCHFVVFKREVVAGDRGDYLLQLRAAGQAGMPHFAADLKGESFPRSDLVVSRQDYPK